MHPRIAHLALAALLLFPTSARAADSAPTPATLSMSEKKAADTIAATLEKRFPTTASAEKAGYVRYTNEDGTGAISYANNKWNSTSEDLPSQLWYDVHGRLLGADYSVLVADHPTAPGLFGISPSRFVEEEAHVHYVVKNADGSLTYSRAVGATKYAASGLDPMHPTAAGLAKVGAVSSPDQVATVFLFPHIWDVTIWVLPNPAGPFANANPDVKPSKMPSASDMH